MENDIREIGDFSQPSIDMLHAIVQANHVRIATLHDKVLVIACTYPELTLGGWLISASSREPMLKFLESDFFYAQWDDYRHLELEWDGAAVYLRKGHFRPKRRQPHWTQRFTNLLNRLRN